MTFSIVASDPGAGEVGVAVQSKFLACASVVSWARGGVGAVATQAFAEVTYGPRGLDLLEQGLDPGEVIDRLVADDDLRQQRQVGVVDARGRSASFTGTECFEHAASMPGDGFSCQGNILASDRVVPAMAEAFRATARMPLGERLIEALRAGQREGGDRRGQEGAGLYVAKPGGGYGGNHDRYIDLRVDHHDEPIEELARLLELHHLYFQRPEESDLLSVDPDLEDEIRSHLERLGKHEGGDLWKDLQEYMGWENLEERWVGEGRIDPKVLAYLRRHAGPA
ncbi:MAG: DUF1028 domain-containing protein [Actinomycetota bacterium]